MTEDEMVGWHHQLKGHEFEQTPGDSEGQGSLACCIPWGHKESDVTEQLHNKKAYSYSHGVLLPEMCFFESWHDSALHFTQGQPCLFS